MKYTRDLVDGKKIILEFHSFTKVSDFRMYCDILADNLFHYKNRYCTVYNGMIIGV